jgi:pyruvate/2-oxoglutarate dehydrogenase complex dihydrolipoamide dehydrogenase (E3) component
LSVTRIGILGGGPAGYEAALVAVELGAEVVLVDRDGIGGACVLTDCVPSKTLIATSEVMTTLAGASSLGVCVYGADGQLRGATRDDWGAGAPEPTDIVDVRVADIYDRVKRLARAQSRDITARLRREGVQLVPGPGRLDGPHVLVADDGNQRFDVDAVLIATGASPRILPEAQPDGERILTWRHLYDLPDLPEHLVVIGSGVTGAEFAGAYRALGSEVTLVSSRDRVLPGEDADAAAVLEMVFRRRGIEVLNRSRAASVSVRGNGVEVVLTDGRRVSGSHALMAVGSVPQTEDLGLAEAGVRLTPGGHIEVDKVSRTSIAGVYAAGDCTGVLPLASVAAMQGRIAMWHALGEAVQPLRLATVSANVFTDPEIATVGVSQAQVEAGHVMAEVVKVPLSTNARAKMQDLRDGFVKFFCRPGTGTVLGGVVVSPRASELILPLSIAVQHSLTVNQIAHTFAIYPSLSGSITEAARQLMQREEVD